MTVTDADKEKGETTDQDDPFFGFDYSHCEDVTVTGDGLALLKLYYNREIWSIKLHTTPMRDYGNVVETEEDVEAEEPGVVAPSGTTYYINDSPVKVVNTSAVKLLFDHIIDSYLDPEETTNTELLKKKTDEVLESAMGEHENVPLTGEGTRHYELKYLDLVDTSNGNVWVAADNTQNYITVYWPLPEGTDSSTQFALLHFPGLHREMGTDEVAEKIDQCPVEIKGIEVTETHIKFNVPRAGFSSFVLVWETEGGTTAPDTDPTPGTDPAPTPGTDPDPTPGTDPQPVPSANPEPSDKPDSPHQPNTSNPPDAPNDPNTPQTGDLSQTGWWALLSGASLMGLVLVIVKKQSYRGRHFQK